MNKAFVKEPDSTQARCPRCGSPGSPVMAETMDAHVAAEARSHLTDSAWFCPFARCEVVYFDQFDRVIERPSVTRPVWPKDPDAPLCACFGLTADDIENDLRSGTVERTRACVEKAKSAAARCTLLSPTGRSCIADVQGYFMRRRAEMGG